MVGSFAIFRFNKVLEFQKSTVRVTGPPNGGRAYIVPEDYNTIVKIVAEHYPIFLDD